ncbi:hypothetical protein A1O7_02241 [Cladophialophora yegresii CBS 114405]|uniref:GTP-binding protein n=1 Tax=Cladophialophora yegresii CBS 114405 TaxID=1182544 RepID=W9WB83_9EURO|nr:uncharacterized protein A1O7_02241 [Cladophialophora yegresii CBS 114405]EXJ61811.1 hypothetical protein A1O7_02241 [Cladophialophora yegresii CBS 114405]
MSRQGEDDAKSTQSIDSLEQRLKLAQINSRLNEFIPDLPVADFTLPRDFLKTDSDEELALKAHTTDKRPLFCLANLLPLPYNQNRLLCDLRPRPRQQNPRWIVDFVRASHACYSWGSAGTNCFHRLLSLITDKIRRSGKSSITNVVFHKTPPQETLFLESTTQIQKDTMHSFMDFQIWDFPGQIDYFDPTFDTNQIFSEIGALVWVIDAQDDYSESLNRLTTTILNLQTTFPHVNVEIFIHKIDSLNDEFRTEVYQDIAQRVGDDLNDAGYINPNVTYHMTSIYDYSIFEAFSRVVQKLIPHLDTLENLMNTLVNNSGMAKAYLFDILTKVYVASDTRPVDMEVYEMCADYIDVTVDITDLYGHERKHGVVLGDQMEETESSMIIHDGSMIYLKEMNRYLCLVTIIKNPEAKDKKGLIDYNVHCFQDSLNELLAQAWREDKGGGEGQDGEGVAQEGLQAQAEN